MFGPFKKSDFPMTVKVQYGEIFGSEIMWSAVNSTDIDPTDGGIECMFGDFSGYDEENQVFTPYPGGIHSNENCIRIVGNEGMALEALKKKKKFLREKMAKMREEFESVQNELADVKKLLDGK